MSEQLEPDDDEDSLGELVAREDGLDLCLPEYEDGDVLDQSVLFLAACFLRAQDDPEWMAEQIKWLGSRMGSHGFDVLWKH